MKYTIVMFMAAALLLNGCAEQVKITSFQECAEHYEVMESDPVVCRTPNGKEFIEPIACTMEYAPVCGIDGNTYSNACVAERQNNVQIAYMGECGEENAFAEAKICTTEYMPVCGMDGVTYSNPCMAGNMQIAYEGECTQNTQIANPASVNCIEQGGRLDIVITDSGEHGVCLLPDGRICEEWALMRGECPDNENRVYCTEEQKSAEVCTMEYRPVCGDDNNTYSNPCMACSSKNIDYWTEGEC